MIYVLSQYDPIQGKCNCGEGCCVQYISYSYGDSVPPGSDYDACPNPDFTCQNSPDASCCGAVLNGYIYSDNFNIKCMIGNPKMTLYAGSLIDNYGSIGSESLPANCPSIGNFPEDKTMDAEIFGTKLRVPISIHNDASCGPYGLYNVSVKWFFE